MHVLLRLADNEYIEWSTVVDAPITNIMTRAVAVMHDGEERVARTDRQGHSYIDFPEQTMEGMISNNRAGPKETRLTLDEIREQYRVPIS